MDFAFEDTPEFWKALAKRVISNAHYKKEPRWMAVQRLTAHGSTYSKDLCRYFGLDPDETKTV